MKTWERVNCHDESIRKELAAGADAFMFGILTFFYLDLDAHTDPIAGTSQYEREESR